MGSHTSFQITYDQNDGGVEIHSTFAWDLPAFIR